MSASEPRERVPYGLRTAAALSWRFLLVAAALVVLGYVVVKLRLVVLPVLVALLFATALVPPARWLRRRGLPDALAALVSVVGSLGLLAGLFWLLGPRIVEQFRDFNVGLREALEKVQEWILTSPLGISEAQLDRYVNQAGEQLRSNAEVIAGGVLSGALVALELLAAIAITLFVLFFFVKDGERMWAWIVSLFPPARRDDARAIGEIGWSTLSGYLRGTALVALVDAVGVAIALLLVGVPLVLPLALLTFLGGFFPIVGAFTAGGAAVLIALVFNGLVPALIVLGAVILVQQLEGNVFQPFIVGRALHLHPVAILLAVTAGAIVWGVFGALLAVPFAAVVAKSAGYLRARAA